MPPVKCQEGYKIARKAGRAYLRLRISQSHYKLRKLASKQQEISKRLAETISVDKNQELSHVILHNTKRLAEKVHNIHSAKLKTIMGND